MTRYLRTRHRLVLGAAVLAAFLFACFIFGVLSVRNTTQGIALIGATFCLIMYWAKPELMIGLALFVGFAALPQGLHIGKVVGPVSIYASHVVLILAICFVLPTVRLRMADYLLPGMFVFTTLYFAAQGISAGHAVSAALRRRRFCWRWSPGSFWR